MSDDDTAATLAWLRRFQGIEPDPELARELAQAVARSCALSERAAVELPFGAEPSGFPRVTRALIRRGDSDDG